MNNLSEIDSLLLQATQGSLCPRIIHQVWMNDSQNIPEKWQNSPVEWKRLHSDWIYVLWTREISLKFIETYEPDFLKTYVEYSHEIQRIDSIRYCFLKRYGGVYADLDIVPLYNLEEIIIDNSNYYFVKSGEFGTNYTNSFMISKKNSSLWNDVIKECKKKVPFWCFGKHLTTIVSAGPRALTKAIYAYDGTICQLPSSRFDSICENPSANHAFKALEGKSWHNWDSTFISFLMNHRTVLIFLLTLVLLLLSYFGIKFLLLKWS